MGKELYESCEQFRAALDEVNVAIERELGRSITELMFAAEGSAEAELLEQTQYTQPALFALEVALYRQWSAWGVRPDVLAGHSVGELSAAHVAGVLSLEDAAKLVVARGRLMQSCESGGAMVSIEASEAEVAAALQAQGGRVDIAGLNGPRQVVVSGDAAAVSAIAAELRAAGAQDAPLAGVACVPQPAHGRDAAGVRSGGEQLPVRQPAAWRW